MESQGGGFMRSHKGAIAAFAIAVVALLAWGVYVFWWFVGNAQSSGLVPSVLGSWTMGNLINFILYAFFYELLLVGIPIIILVVAAWRWWSRLPMGDKWRWGRGSKTTRGSGGVGFFFFIAFAIKVYLDGNWNSPIAGFSLNYVVGSMIYILVLAAAIIGIPAAIAALWWVNRRMGRA